MEKSNFDVLTFHSNSYFGHKKAFQFPVGDGEGPLPVLDGSQPSMLLCRRFRGKRKPLQQDVRLQRLLLQDVSEETSVPDVGAPGIGSQPSTKHPLDTAASPNSLRTSSDTFVSVNGAKAASSCDTPPTMSQATHITENGTLLCIETRRCETRCRDDEIHIENTSSDQGMQTLLTLKHVDYMDVNVDQLRNHIKGRDNCQATKIFLQDLPAELRAFLVA